jgi:tripartite ATP-independent transporter DctM subunit
MIPPSLTMIIYGVITETSVARLFAAGLIPGLMLGAFYSLYIWLRARANPEVAPADPGAGTWRARLKHLPDLLPIAFLIVIVLGGIYSGVATPSEAAALGVGGTLLVMLVTRQARPALLMSTAMAAVRTTAMLGTAFAAAAVLSTALGLMHVPQTVAAWISSLGLSPLALILLIGAVYILLGCVLESVSMILMSMPITFPLVMAAGYDPIWFGVFIVLVVEMGLVTPPIGFNLFVMRGITGYPIGEIARGAFPFFLIMVGVAGLLIAMPEIALWLPKALFG